MSLMISFSLHSIPSSHPNLWYGIIDIEFSPFQGLLWSSCCQNEHRMRRATRCSSFCVLYVVSWCYLYAWMSSALVDNNISYRIGFLYTSNIPLLWYLSDVCSIRNCQLASTLYTSTPAHIQGWGLRKDDKQKSLTGKYVEWKIVYHPIMFYFHYFFHFFF